MGSLAKACATLAETLDARGFRATAEVPQTFSPPLCYVAFVGAAAGQTFAEWRVEMVVWCLAGYGTNSQVTTDALDLAQQVAALVDDLPGYRLDGQFVGQLQALPMPQGQDCIAAPVSVVTKVPRG